MVSLAPATYHWCVGSWSDKHVLPALEAILKGNCRWSMHVYAMFREGECTTTAYVNMQVNTQKRMEYITLNMSNCTTICKTGTKTPQNHRSNTNAVMFNWYVHQKTERLWHWCWCFPFSKAVHVAEEKIRSFHLVTMAGLQSQRIHKGKVWIQIHDKPINN